MAILTKKNVLFQRVYLAYATNLDYSSPDKNESSFLDWKKHTRNYNQDYERYDSYDYYVKGHLSGSDCTNFISQAFYAGGIQETDYSEQVSGYIDEYGIQRGDCIYLKNDEEGLHHAMMITDIKDGKIYISAHSNDHINSVYDQNYFEDGNIGVIVRMY